MSQGNPPDYNVVVKRMDGVGVNNKVGVMWWDFENNRGSIALDAGVQLSWKDELYINVYPRENNYGGPPTPPSGGGLSGGSRGHGGPPPPRPPRGGPSDDIPF